MTEDLTFDLDLWTETALKIVEPEIDKQSLDSIRNTLKRLDFDNPVTEFDTQRKITVSESAKKIKTGLGTISEDLKLKITGLLKENYDKPADELTEIIIDNTDNYFNDSYSQSNAKRIARTTSSYTENKSQYELAKTMNLGKVWITERDSRVRASHARLDGEITEADGEFTLIATDKDGKETGRNTCKHPVGSENAGEDINCRCIIRLERV